MADRNTNAVGLKTFRRGATETWGDRCQECNCERGAHAGERGMGRCGECPEGKCRRFRRFVRESIHRRSSPEDA